MNERQVTDKKQHFICYQTIILLDLISKFFEDLIRKFEIDF
jgi:hypothetical protein